MRSLLSRSLTGAILASLALFIGAQPVVAQTTRTLYTVVAPGGGGSPIRDDFDGTIGCRFRVGSSNVVVSHLGTFDEDGLGLAVGHRVVIFSGDGSTILGWVTNNAGTGDYFTNSFRWAALNPPLLLSANTDYIVSGEAFSACGDAWYNNNLSLTWDTSIVGTNAGSTRISRWGYLNAWNAAPMNDAATDTTFANANLAYIAIGSALAGVQSTNVAAPAGSAVNLVGFAAGEPTITYQWYKAPATLLTGKTNATLTFASAQVSDSGTYYLTATNGLGGSQSENVVLTVSAVPVSIAQSPTNVTVYGQFPVSFSVTAAGTAPVYYHWLRNGTPIAGTNSATYSFTATTANNGDTYSCIASNYISGTPYTATSGVATLTVNANVSNPDRYLHGYRPIGLLGTNNYTGNVGCYFRSGATESRITHLGFYASQYVGANHAELLTNHEVGIYAADGTTLIGSVVVPMGTNEVVNGYMWMPLTTPITLAANTYYCLWAEATAGVDPWGESYVVPDWNSYFVGAERWSVYGSGLPISWFGGWFGGQAYSAGNLGMIATGAPQIWVSPTNITQYATFNATITAEVNGAIPVTIQWYKAPGTLLPGQTGTTLTLTNLTVGDAGDYFLRAMNSTGTNDSSNVSLTVIPTTGPIITQEPQSKTAYVHQSPQFSVVVTGPPVPFSYQWSFNGSPIGGATNATLVLGNVAASKQGNYAVSISNPYGSTNSATVSLTVLSPPSGSYAASALEHLPLIYYRFSDAIDVGAGSTNVLNIGSLAEPWNATFEAFCTPGSGPQPPAYARFESTNQAVVLDGGAGTQIRIPALNLTGATQNNATIAAWVNLNGPQADYTGLVFGRSGGQGNGVGLKNDTNAVPNMLQYHWANQHNGFDSGLYVPQNQWVFVALVVEPTRGTLYLHDGTNMLSATNVATHNLALLSGVSYVGWDPAAGSGQRQLNGAADEVMVFGRALSGAEISMLQQGVAQGPLTISQSGGNVVLTWPFGGTLQQADLVTGAYADVPSATSPYTNAPAGTNKFYRVKLN